MAERLAKGTNGLRLAFYPQAETYSMAEVVLFPTGPRRLRTIKAREIGVIVPFPPHVSKRRWDQLLREHIARVLHERLRRQRRWDTDQEP